jgi:hypothetical protein
MNGNEKQLNKRRSIVKQYMGSIDRTLRVLAVVVIGISYFTGIITGTLAIVLPIFAIVFLLTSAIGFCPLNLPLKISTMKKRGA